MARGAMWAFVERAGNQVISFVVFMFVARLIGPEQYGLASLCFVVFSLANLLILGLVDGIIALQITDARRLSTMFWCVMGVGALLTIGSLGGADVVADLMDEPRFAPLLRWFSITFICLSGSVVPNKLIYASLDFRLIALRTVIAATISGIVGLGAAIYGLGAYAIVAQQVTLQIIINLIVWPNVAWRPSFVFEPEAIRECMAPGLKMTGINLILFFEEQVPRICIAAVLGPISLGYYAFVMRLRFALEEIVINPSLSVLYPSLSVTKGDAKEQGVILGHVIRIMSGLIFPALAIAMATAPLYVPLFFGAKWVEATVLLQIYFVGSAAVPALTTIREAMRAHNRAGAYMSLQIAVVAVTLSVIAYLVSYGLVTMAIGAVACVWLSVPIYAHFFKRWLGISLWRPLFALLKPLSIACIAAWAIELCRGLAIVQANAWFGLLLSIGVGLTVYLGLSLIVQLDDIRSLVAFGRSTLRSVERNGKDRILDTDVDRHGEGEPSPRVRSHLNAKGDANVVHVDVTAATGTTSGLMGDARALGKVGQSGSGGLAIAFGDCAGFYHPARGGVGVLMCSPWGYEELCARASWRRLADELAAAGFPTLRFDYPGVGDSLGSSNATWRLTDWTQAARSGAELLRNISGAHEIIVLGQGLGAIVACLTAQDAQGVVGVAALAGFGKGRTAMRELAAGASMLASQAGVAQPSSAHGELTMLGFNLPASLVADFKAVDLLASRAPPAARMLSVAREHHQTELDLADHWESLGARVERLTYAGYEELVSNPTTAQYPLSTFGDVVERLSAWAQGRAQAGDPVAEPPAASLETDAYRETAVRFGASGCFGVLCEPKRQASDETLLFVNCGANPHTGWRRMTVEHARLLAERGVRSLRIDTAGIGDSPERGDGCERLYTEEQVAESLEAVDWLARQGAGRIAVFGVCAGAYVAVQTAFRDPRVSSVFAVNPFLFVMDPKATIDDYITVYARSNSDYFRRLLQWSGIRKVLTGQAPTRRQFEVVASRIWFKLRMLTPFGAKLSSDVPLFQDTHAVFARLLRQQTRVSLVTSEGDVSEDEIPKYFGKGEERLAEYPNVRRHRLMGADHTLTNQESVDWVRDHLLECLAREPEAVA